MTGEESQRSTLEYLNMGQLEQSEFALCDELPPKSELNKSVICILKDTGIAYSLDNGDWVEQSAVSDFIWTMRKEF